MKKIIYKVIAFSAFVLLLFGCSLSVKVLKGSYLDKPFEIISEKSFDEVWSNVIDLFATKGLSVKIIDKTSGLIVSEKTSFISEYSYEDNNGNLENPDAWLAVERIYYAGGYSPIHPKTITGEWNVRIKNGKGGNTIINVNLTNIQAEAYIGTTNSEVVTFKAKSTGKFEEIISNLVK